jgi:hypothetical protein
VTPGRLAKGVHRSCPKPPTAQPGKAAPDALRALLVTAVDHALHAKVGERVDAMVYAREQCEQIEVLARMATPDAEINVLRQAFLLVMTAFDAAVFDLTRIGFRRKFFDMVGSSANRKRSRWNRSVRLAASRPSAIK